MSMKVMKVVKNKARSTMVVLKKGEKVLEAEEPAGKKARVLKKPAAKQSAEEVEQELEAEEPAGKKARVLKKPAAKQSAEQQELEEEEPAAKKARVLKKPAAKQSAEQVEKELVAARTKELKSMYKEELQELILKNGLEKGGKGEMVETLVANEAKHREQVREQEAKAREVVIKLREELAAKSATELSESCESKGLKKGGSKEEKVERLLALAKDSGEVRNVLSAQARELRREQLHSMDKDALMKLCNKSGVDFLMKEVMVDRMIAHENAAGAFKEGQ